MVPCSGKHVWDSLSLWHSSAGWLYRMKWKSYSERVGFLWVSTNHDVKTVGVKGNDKWFESPKGQEVMCAFPRAEKWLVTQASDKKVHKNTSILFLHRGSSGMSEEPFLGESQGMEIWWEMLAFNANLFQLLFFFRGFLSPFTPEVKSVIPQEPRAAARSPDSQSSNCKKQPLSPEPLLLTIQP